MSLYSQGEGWWLAVDGRWYPPEQHPGYQAPAPIGAPPFVGAPSGSQPQYVSPAPPSSGRKLAVWIGIAGAVVVVLVVAGLVVASAGNGSSKASQTTTASTSPSGGNAAAQQALQSLVQQWSASLATETAANQADVAAIAAVNADVTKQEQRIQQDESTYNSNEYGVGCSGLSPTYLSCVQSEDQQAASAQTDYAAANAQIQTDDQQYATSSATYEGALSTFIGQIIALPWPSSLNTAVNTLVTAARTFRNDVVQQAAVTPSTPQATVQAIQAQTGEDLGNFNDAISVVKAALLQDASAVSGG